MKKSLVIFALLTLLISGAVAAGKVIYVDDDGPADFDNIQAAIDDASDGDTVIVADGRYMGAGNRDIDFKGKGITVKSKNGPENCVIDCNGTESEPHRGFRFHSGEDANSIVSGLTITGGYGPEEEYLYYEHPVKRSFGGGIYCVGSSPTIINCKITRNIAKEDGGGVYLQGAGAPRLIGCTISENRAGNIGGGMATERCSGWTHNCVFSKNSAAAGGGVGFRYAAAPTLSFCRISDNSANGYGGGIIGVNSGVTITNCIITKNTAVGGGGIFTGRYCFFYGQLTIKNCTFSRNEATSEGGAIFCGECSFPSVSNCVLWADKANQGQEIAMLCGDFGSELSISYSILQGGQVGVARGPYEPCKLNWGPGNIDVDPLFRDPNNSDYCLKSQAGSWNPNTKSWVQDDGTSPCIDAGDPNSPIALEPFPNGGRINIGAYGGTAEASKSYFSGPVCETVIAGDINGDCRVDSADLALMASHWLKCVGPECGPVLKIWIRVMLPVYSSGEDVHIWITASNDSADPATLVFPDGLQVSYTIDGVFDWPTVVQPVPVPTHITIEPHTYYSWMLTHGPYEMKKYPLAVGRHTVVGKVIGYGQSEPDEFEVRSSF